MELFYRSDQATRYEKVIILLVCEDLAIVVQAVEDKEANISILKFFFLEKESSSIDFGQFVYLLRTPTLCFPREPNGKGWPVFVSIISISLSKMRSSPSGKASGI